KRVLSHEVLLDHLAQRDLGRHNDLASTEARQELIAFRPRLGQRSPRRFSGLKLPPDTEPRPCSDETIKEEVGVFMATRTVTWFSNDKGYGFITPDAGGEVLFVHHTEIAGSGFKTLAEGAKVEFEV